MAEYKPIRCAMWFEKTVMCISRTESWSKQLCPQHYQHYLIEKYGKWSNRFPIGFKVHGSSIYKKMAPEVYEKARETQLAWKGNSRNFYEVKPNTLFKLRADDHDE